ncbi:hypothetical protein TanjilG_16493 [Lupinus angustifolius]|uniref:Uncharacterized protein n=1 Tax=Lupinus angustifolius TaxID=3871 RepID=A0A1J7HKR9_LUPAN|nr:PREDICTED: uncharacterized protein LOC109345917 [Lupinus angustifolius]OIW13384.1 hypothetical protein TanjilG_16493 [Lupinus angustifolius]
MQSRLAYGARRTSYVLFSSPNRFTIGRGFCSGSRSKTADPAIHSGELEAGPDVHRKPPQGSSQTADPAIHSGELEAGPDVHRAPPQGTNNNAGAGNISTINSKGENLETEATPKIKSTGVNQRLDPNLQQKRNEGTTCLENVSCAGLDGTPWPNDKEKEHRIQEEQIEDNREYYQHHKASPLSELEFADTRKPISRATDEPPSDDVIGWLPEQLDTAEETLRRATEIWRENAMRGDPDAPHSRVLRNLRGEEF